MDNDSICDEQHLCLFYKKAADLWPLCLPRLQQAEHANLTWLYIADEHSRDDIRYTFETTLAETLPAGDILDAASLGMLDTPISIDQIIRHLQTQIELRLTQPNAKLLLFVEMTWLLRTASGPAYLGEYEAALHHLTQKYDLQTLCLYNQRVLPESFMTVGLRTHPYLIAADGIHPNPHFLPPHVFLSGDRQAQLQHWLKTISPTFADDGGPSPTRQAENSSGRPNYRSTTNTAKTPIYSLESPVPLAAANSDQQRWKIHCLGRLRVYRQDGTPVKWNVVSGATLKTKTLFTYLLHRGQEGATLEEIATLLWPTSNDMDLSLNRLYHTVHCLRMALSPELTSSRHSPFVLQHDQRYFLAIPKGTWVDIPIFEQLCYKGDRLTQEHDYEQALICALAAEKLYSGDLLEDIPVEYAANIDQDWCWSRRYWLREMYLKLLSTIIAQSYRLTENTAQALTYCEQALRLDPYSDSAHQEMMRIFHATGRRDALTRQYRLYCQAMDRFDGGDPSPSTQSLYQSLLETL